MNALRFNTLLCLTLILLGCVSSRTTTTDRTAVEQALLTEAAERVIAQFPATPVQPGLSYYLVETEFKKPEDQFILAALRNYLLRSGLREVRWTEKKEEAATKADLVVEARAAVSGIDDSDFLIGVPEYNFSLGLVGFTIPELALFKRVAQTGRSRLALHAANSSDGRLAFDIESTSAQTYYNRYKLLFLISWRTTDLEEPF